MKIIYKDFLKGMLAGMFFLSLKFSLAYFGAGFVYAEDIRTELRDEIRSQVQDLRDSAKRPCEDDPRESCARPIPSRPPHRSPEPSSSPQQSPSLAPTPIPSPVIAPSPSPSPGVGGNGCHDCGGGDDDKEDDSKTESTEEAKVKAPQVLGLSYTGS